MLLDNFGRTINYLRLSVTDRCDFRCVYCMSEDMQFLPRADILSLEEITQIAEAFVELGVSKIRITGGEPLVRRNINQLFKNLGQLTQLDELTLTTNGSQLSKYADDLVASRIKRINVSLDSLDKERFLQLTRTGNLEQVLEGIDSALDAGLKIKLNSVILKNRNSDEVLPLVDYAIQKSIDISFIEEMPLGNISEHQRDEEFISSEALRTIIGKKYLLKSTPEKSLDTSGPSRYWSVDKHATRIGFISPHSDNFCSSCNRVRLTAEGRLLLCLGQENSVDLRHIVRSFPNDKEKLKQTILGAINNKPEKHDFVLDDEPQIVRFMNMTGG